jgi:hypothetical protein
VYLWVQEFDLAKDFFGAGGLKPRQDGMAV